MGQVLGLGMTHYPNLSYKGNMCIRIQRCLDDPALPEKFRDKDNWHPTMRAQWGQDDGQAHSGQHRCATAIGRSGARPRSKKSRTAAITRCSIGSAWRARCTRSAIANRTNRCSSNPGSRIPTRCSRCFGRSRKLKHRHGHQAHSKPGPSAHRGAEVHGK